MLTYFTVPFGWGEILKRTARETYKDDCLSMAAQLAYYFFLALFPALLFLIALASFFPVDDLMKEIVGTLGRFAPPDVTRIIEDQIRKIADGEDGGILTFAFVFTIWSSSGATVSIISTFNRAYDVIESRPWWKVRLIAIALTAAIALFILVAFALVIAGPSAAEMLAEKFGLGTAFEWTWTILQWPVVFALVASGIGIVYYFAPDAEQSWVWLTPGAVCATVLWLITSLGFKAYLAAFANYNETYGAIGGVMVLMLWFYLSGLAILVGAEMNAEIDHASPYGKDPGARTPGEKKKIGVAAAMAYETRKADPAAAAAMNADDENCPIDRPMRAPVPKLAGWSEVLVGAIALVPVALARGWKLRKGSTPYRRP